MIKAINIVMSDVGNSKLITFNIDIDGVVQAEPNTSLKVFTTTVATEPDAAAAVQSILADYLSSITTPSNPVDLEDIEL